MTAIFTGVLVAPTSHAVLSALVVIWLNFVNLYGHSLAVAALAASKASALDIASDRVGGLASCKIRAAHRQSLRPVMNLSLTLASNGCCWSYSASKWQCLAAALSRFANSPACFRWPLL